MKKYIHPLTVILKSEYVLMAGESANSYTNEVGNGTQLTNESVFEEDDVDPSKGKGFWDDAN